MSVIQRKQKEPQHAEQVRSKIQSASAQDGGQGCIRNALQDIFVPQNHPAANNSEQYSQVNF